MTLYAKRNIVELDKQGEYYCRHVSAMTTENLYSKSEIAAELAWRDSEIARLTSERDLYIERLEKVSRPLTPEEIAAAWRNMNGTEFTEADARIVTAMTQLICHAHVIILKRATVVKP